MAMRRAAWGTVLLGVVAFLSVTAPAWASTGAGPSARPIEGRTRNGPETVTSTNWSGYADYGATFERVAGSWTQPEASCAEVRGRKVTLAAFWVGLDGYESNTVEQTGTEADCEGSRPVYYAWYELYPQRLFLIEHPVEPGDAFHAEVTQGALILKDETKGWEAEESYLPEKLAFNSAEWIAEAPSKSLTDFGSVGFSGAQASREGGEGTVEAFTHVKIDAVSHPGPRGVVRAETGELEGGGSTFSIAWKQR